MKVTVELEADPKSEEFDRFMRVMEAFGNLTLYEAANPGTRAALCVRPVLVEDGK